MPEIVRRLALYVRMNPLAGDTKEGITQWWLNLDPSFIEPVASALARLQAAELIDAVGAVDGRVRYRRRAPGSATDALLDRLIAGFTVPNE
ncbi:hypothetical protein [Dyella subtropica]|uniref:hypothetical protein n=1 Tax=Dyella subtropica TaxID=2992127 RepID=UPI002250EA09|nr:hypothetical protein [Dyella subtropica]